MSTLYLGGLSFGPSSTHTRTEQPATGLIVAGVIAVIFNPGPEEEASEPARAQQARTAAPARTPQPANVEDCFNPLDGNLDALEDLVRPILNDPGSMRTHETRFSSAPDAQGYHSVRMDYSAENAFGGRIRAIAHGRVHRQNCHVILISPGF